MGKIKIISQCVMVMNRTGVGSAYQRRTSREVGVEKGPSPLPDRAFGASKPVSRVLSFKTAIYLDVPLPTRSSHLLNAAGPACCVTTVLLRIEFTAMSSSQSSGGRLSPPFHPYLVDISSMSLPAPPVAQVIHFAISPLPTKTYVFAGAPSWGRGGISLLHFS